MDIKSFTEEERQFAEKNHDLVYAFLHEKGLCESEFYDVVIFGYLNAVHQYCNRLSLHHYRFSTLAWKQMNRSLSNYYKYLSSSKRNAKTVSLENLIANKDGLCWIDIIQQPDEAMIQLETELLLHALATKLPRREMRIICMRVSGMKINDIAKMESVSPRTIGRLITSSYDTVIDVLWG